MGGKCGESTARFLPCEKSREYPGFIGTAVLFLPFFVFLPKLIQYGMKADTAAAFAAFGKNEQIKKVFRALFVAMAGLVLARFIASRLLGILWGLLWEWNGENSVFFITISFLNYLQEERPMR